MGARWEFISKFLVVMAAFLRTELESLYGGRGNQHGIAEANAIERKAQVEKNS